MSTAGQAAVDSRAGIAQMVALVDEQAHSSAAIAQNVEHFARTAEENHAAMEKSSQSLQQMRGIADGLRVAVGRFQI
jgi:methyl-accepting chemotaxis protein